MTTTWTTRETEDLGRRVAGRVIDRAAADYDDARAVWNAMIDRRPAALVRAASTADIAPTIAFARRLGLAVAIRGGGHNVAGNGTVEDGIVLDLGDLTDVTVDPVARTVTAQAGDPATHRRATQQHGLAVPIGVVSGTGVAGLTPGGGVGWLTRLHGLTADALIGAELVTADGDLLRVSRTEHPELLWALRGGGGDFGVVTSFTFRAYPLGPEAFCGSLVYGVPNWRQAWRALAARTQDLPDEMTTITTTVTPPPMMEMGDQPLLLVGFAWASEHRAQGEGLVQRLRETAPPDDEEVGEVAWVDWQSAFDALVPKGVRDYWAQRLLRQTG